MGCKKVKMGRRSKKVWGVVFGQIISLLLALAGLFSNELATSGVSIPIGQCIPMYACLLLAHIPNATRQHSCKAAKPVNKWWKYLIAGFLDAQALTTTVIAYQKASLSLVTLLQLLSLPSAMVGSLIFKTAKYRVFHYITALMAAIGMVVSVALSASFMGDSVVGGILGAVGAIIYGMMNSIAEKFMQDCSQFEYLAYLSTFAIPFVVAETCIFELSHWENDIWTGASVGWEVGYIVDVVGQYVLISIFVCHFPVTLLNMSFLTTSVYGMVFDAFVLGGTIQWYTILCAVWIIVFTALFASKPPVQLVRGVPKDQLGLPPDEVKDGDADGENKADIETSQCVVKGEISCSSSSEKESEMRIETNGTTSSPDKSTNDALLPTDKYQTGSNPTRSESGSEKGGNSILGDSDDGDDSK